jgi:hypothetical protein
MTEHEKPDLSKIEPIGRPLDADDTETAEDVTRVGRTAAAISGAPPAVGVEEAKTSPETEAQLEELRRG